LCFGVGTFGHCSKPTKLVELFAFTSKNKINSILKLTYGRVHIIVYAALQHPQVKDAVQSETSLILSPRSRALTLSVALQERAILLNQYKEPSTKHRSLTEISTQEILFSY